MAKKSVLVRFGLLLSLSLIIFQNCAKINFSDESSTNTENGGANSSQDLSCELSQFSTVPSDIDGPSTLQVEEEGVFKFLGYGDCASSVLVWRAGDGSPKKQTKEFHHEYSNAGIYYVGVEQKLGSEVVNTASHRVDVPVSCSSPADCGLNASDIFITGPQFGQPNQAYDFSLVSPSGVTITSVEWTFGDDDSGGNSFPTQGHTFEHVGEYLVTAEVTTSGGVKSLLKHKITIMESPSQGCSLESLAISSPTLAQVDQEVHFEVHLPDCLKSMDWHYQWDFGDGGSSQPLSSADHSFSEQGYYKVTVKLTHAKECPEGEQHEDTTTYELSRWIRIVETDDRNCGHGGGGHHEGPKNRCDIEGQKRTNKSGFIWKREQCEAGGYRDDKYQDVSEEICKKFHNRLQWVTKSKKRELISRGECQGKACKLPPEAQDQIPQNNSNIVIINGEAYLRDGANLKFYSNMSPAGSCESVGNIRTCRNGVLDGLTRPCTNCGQGVQFFIYLICKSGCPGLGPDGTKKEGVVNGNIEQPKQCPFGETGIFDIYEKLEDQLCRNGQVETSNQRTGRLLSQGQCPIYSWKPKEEWTTCSADCGGTQTQVYECVNEQGAISNGRCQGSPPSVTRVCDKNPDLLRIENKESLEEVGSCTACPSNQIGIVLGKRKVFETKTFACIDHTYKQSNVQTTYGEWDYETYCRPFENVRCGHDSLDNTQAEGRYKWMVKCQDKFPLIAEFLNKFKDVEFSGKDIWGYQQNSTSLMSQGRRLYPTFLTSDHSTPWIAPKSQNSACEMPEGAYVAAVCVSSCATPEQQILVGVDQKPLTFVKALMEKTKEVTVLNPSLSTLERPVLKTKLVDQWVTELIDSDHKILVFDTQSGGQLKVTLNHPLLTSEGSMKEASQISVGESLVKADGTLDPIVSITQVIHRGKVYNVFVKSNDPQENIVVTNGYLNGSAFFQNEGTTYMNREIFRNRMTQGIFNR